MADDKIRSDDLPNLANATLEFLIDEVGEARAAEARAKRLNGFLTEAIKGRLKEFYAQNPTGVLPTGERFELSISRFKQSRIDPDKAREVMTPEQLAECTVESDVVQMRLKKK